MTYQSVFKRYELKYMITQAQKERILTAMKPYMEMDEYGRVTVRNIYFDTDSYRLIRRSIEKPAYKEKLRIRSYKRVGPDSPVFVELKKKYKSVVYKRRVSLPEKTAMEWLAGERELKEETQISKEIEYFCEYYKSLKPAVFLSYEREAYRSSSEDGLRITFDDHIYCRQTDLSLEEEIGGDSLLEEGLVLMEIKTPGGIPLWMTKTLTKEKIYKTSFSKYGRAYQNYIFKNKGEKKDERYYFSRIV